MNTTTRGLIGVLAIGVIALGIGFGVAKATDSNGSSQTLAPTPSASSNYWSSGNGDPYYGMMGAMGQGNWQAMQGYMRQILGDQGYQQMLDHMRADGCDWSYGNGNTDAYWHDMMYGMMYRMYNNGATPSGPSPSPGAPGYSCW